MAAGQGRVHVREGRHGRELRVDGTLASYYRPGAATTGSVWDAIAAPILALEPRRRRSALVLGLGGGSAARLIRTLAPEAHIVGVELDADVVAAARSHFDLDALGVEIVLGEALSVLRRERRRFDIVVEDVFVGITRHVRKPEGFPLPGLELAWRRVAKGGVLISNTIHEGPAVGRALRQVAPGHRVVSVGVRDYYNHILAAGPAALAPTELRRRLTAQPHFRDALPRLSFRTL
jgi:spermidine synthase